MLEFKLFIYLIIVVYGILKLLIFIFEDLVI